MKRWKGSSVPLFPRDKAVWLFALVPMLPLCFFGWDSSAFLPVALAGAVLAGAARPVLEKRGPVAARLGDALVLAAVLFPLAALAVGVLGQLLDFVAGMASPLAVNPIEGREAFKAWLLAQGHNIYAGPGQGGDILITLYGPFYYALAALAECALGPGLFAARLVSLVAAVALLTAIFALVRRETGSSASALLAALALFCAPLLEYGHFARPDMTAWALFFLAVWAFSRAVEPGDAASGPGKALCAAIVLAVAALLAKQQTWPPLCGLFLYGLLRRRFKLTAIFAVATLALGGAAFLALNRVTDGRFLFETFGFPRLMAGIADMNVTAWALDRLGVFAKQNWPDLVLLAGYGLAAAAKRRLTFIEPLLLACLGPLFVVLRWTGAEYNHFLPVVILAKTAGGILAARLARTAGKSPWGVPAVVAVLALMVVPPTSLESHARSLLAKQDERGQRHAVLDQALAAHPGPVLSDAEAAYLFLGRPTQRVTAYDAFESSIYELLGLVHLGAAPLGQGIRDRRFALVLTTPTFQPKSVASLLALYYQPLPAKVPEDPVVRLPRPETAVLGIHGPDAPPASQGGLTISLTPLSGLDVKPGFLTADGRDRPGRLVIDLASGRPLQRLAVTFFPRMNLAEKGAAITLELEAEDGSRTVLWSREGGSGTGWTPEPGERSDVRVPAALAVTARRLVFTLRGPAQLWLGDAQPILVAADPGVQ